MTNVPQDNPLIGLTIAAVRPMNQKEIQDEGWDLGMGDDPIVIEFDDGSNLYAMRDPEGNGPGVLIHNCDSKSYYIMSETR